MFQLAAPTDSISPSPLDDTNTLAVPTAKSRTESWSSSPSTKVGTDHEQMSREVEALRKGDQAEILKPDPGEEDLFHVVIAQHDDHEIELVTFLDQASADGLPSRGFLSDRHGVR